MVGVWEGLNLGSIPNFFPCFGIHPKIIDVHPKLIPRGGVIQFYPPFNLAATANTTSYNNITIVIFGLRLAFRIFHSNIFRIIVHTIFIFLVPYKSSCYSPLDIGTDADTDTTQSKLLIL